MLVVSAYLQVAEYFIADKPKRVEGGTLVCRRMLLVLIFPSRVRFCAQHLAWQRIEFFFQCATSEQLSWSPPSTSAAHAAPRPALHAPYYTSGLNSCASTLGTPRTKPVG